MFVAHGYDAWVAPANKIGLGYRVTREIAAAAIPSFFLLAGLSIGLRWLRVPPGEHPAMRGALALRGLRLIAAGYALSLAYAALDGGLERPEIWLRSDVLHAIGASMLVLAALLFAARSDAGLQAGRLQALKATNRVHGVVAVVAVLIVALWPVLARSSWWQAHGSLGYALAPFLPVDGITRFAAVPLVVFCIAGVTHALYHHGANVPRSVSAFLLVTGPACVWVVAPETRVWLHGAAPTEDNAMRYTVVGGLGRGLFMLSLVRLLPAPSLAPFTLLGRHSLLLYAVHIPFCYGRFGKPLRARLDLAQASLALAVLTGAALLLAACFEAYSARRAGQRSGP